MSYLNCRCRIKPALLGLLFYPFVSLAATNPDAGSMLQQVKPSVPPAPSSGETGLKIEQQGSAKLPPSAPFEVRTIHITGNTLFDTQTLHALVADAEGKQLNLSELAELAARITNYYHSHGHLLARAIIPAQTISDGVLTVQVIEAHYGKISLDNRSRVGGGLLQSTLDPLHSGQEIGQREMDHVLLLLSDIPGIKIDAILKPGAEVGSSDLDVQATTEATVTGNVTADNYGSRYTGKARAGGSVRFINPLHHGDVLSANVIASGSGMDYGRIGYESLLNGLGTRVGGSYSAVHYVLGDTLTSLLAHGTAQVGSLWVKHPFLRGRELNIYAQLQYDQKNLRDHIDSSSIRTDRHLDNWILSLGGDTRDTLWSGGINTCSLGWTSGRVSYDDATASNNDATTARTQGSFSKLNYNFSRLQSLSSNNELFLNVAGQWSNKNLDSAEKMSVGGPYSVRAYDMGAASGDTGYFGSVELRHSFGQTGGQYQALLFVDSAHITANRNPWVTGANSATLSGAGIGINWAADNQWHATAYFAKRLSSVSSLVGNSPSSRAWIEVGKAF